MVDISKLNDGYLISQTNYVELDSHNKNVESNNHTNSLLNANESQNNDVKPEKPWLFQKGQVGNPTGRPVGAKNMPNLGGPITQETIDKLETFSKPELIHLIRKVSGAVWGIGIMNDDQAFECVRLKLLHTGLTSESANSSLSVLREWSDRTKGKPAQSIQMKVEEVGLSKLSDERLLRLERELARQTGMDAILISPEPKKLIE